MSGVTKADMIKYINLILQNQEGVKEKTPREKTALVQLLYSDGLGGVCEQEYVKHNLEMLVSRTHNMFYRKQAAVAILLSIGLDNIELVHYMYDLYSNPCSLTDHPDSKRILDVLVKTIAVHDLSEDTLQRSLTLLESIIGDVDKQRVFDPVVQSTVNKYLGSPNPGIREICTKISDEHYREYYRYSYDVGRDIGTSYFHVTGFHNLGGVTLYSIPGGYNQRFVYPDYYARSMTANDIWGRVDWRNLPSLLGKEKESAQEWISMSKRHGYFIIAMERDQNGCCIPYTY